MNFFVYSQVPNKYLPPPALIDFSIFFHPPRTLLGPPFITSNEIDFIYEPLISFTFFESTIYAQFSWQNTFFFIRILL